VLIRLNGEPYTLDAPITVSQLLEKLGIDPRRVAVERNFIVLKRALYGDTVLHDGDEIEIVNFVGGGAPAARASGGEAPRALKMLTQPERRDS
jgi:thiamine biosynthesis protein ThiS